MLLYLLLPLVVVTVLSSIFFYLHLSAQAESRAQVHLAGYSRAVARQAQSQLLTIATVLDALRSSGHISNLFMYHQVGLLDYAEDARGNVESEFHRLTRQQPVYSSLHLINRAGRSLVDIVDGRINYHHRDFSNEPWFKKTLTDTADNLQVAAPPDCRTEHGNRLWLAKKVINKIDQTVGLIALQVEADYLLGSTRLGGAGIHNHTHPVHLVNTSGCMIASESSHELGADLTDFLEGNTQGINPLDSKEIIAASLELQQTGLRLVATWPLEEVHAQSSQFGIYNAIIIGIALVLLIAIIGFVTQRLTRPVTSLKTEVERLTIDSPEIRLPQEVLNTRNEIGSLARAFEDMGDALAEQVKALEASEQQVRLLLESAGDGIFGVDGQGNCSFINPAAQEMLGYKEDELLGKKIHQAIHYAFEDGSAYPESDCPMRQSYTEGAVIRGKEEVLWRKDGSALQVEYSSTPIHSNGSVVGVVVSFHDISIRKQAEAESNRWRHYLQDIFDSMPSVLAGVDASGHVQHWNLKAASRLGISASEATGTSLTKLLSFEQETLDAIQQAIISGESLVLHKLSIEDEGEDRYINIIVYPLHAADLEGAVVRLDDVTELVKMEKMLLQTEKMLSVGGLAAGMAHEINNPLGGILQGLQNIQRRLAPEFEENKKKAEELGLDLSAMSVYFDNRGITGFLQGIKDSGERAALIVSNMLQFSRQAEPEYKVEQIDMLIDQALSLIAIDYDLKKKYDFQKIKIIKEYETSPIRILCNASEIQQVLLNLFQNAAQALLIAEKEIQQPQIIIRAYEQGDMTCMEVEDNGSGMDEETKAHVFDPFFTTRSVGEGAGLGLSVSYFIVTQEHNGKMYLESETGRGARFIFCLPSIKATQ